MPGPFNPARKGDVVMTPTNVSARVLDATGSRPDDTVEVEEVTPERWHNTWRQNQLVVQTRRPTETDNVTRGRIQES